MAGPPEECCVKSEKSRVVNMLPPRVVSFRLTNECNLRCKHCCVSAEEPWENELSTEEVKKTIDQLSKFDLHNLTFTGGEPMMRKDFWEILSHTNQSRVPFEIFTNGTFLDDEAIRKLEKMENLVAVAMSLDGTSPRTHDFIHALGNFELVTSLLKKLVDRNIPVRCHLCVNKINFLEYKEIINMALELGASLTHVAQVSMEGRAKDNENGLKLTPNQIAEIAYHVFLMKDGRVCFDIPNCKTTCITQCMICPNGDMVPCRLLYSLGMTAGNLRRKSFLEIWTNSDLFVMRRTISVEELKGCSECDFKYGCWGGCRVMACYYSKNWLGQQDPFECGWRKTYFKKVLGV
jgi:radical SAM protein with 4Fe4S-binding SPASM domain